MDGIYTRPEVFLYVQRAFSVCYFFFGLFVWIFSGITIFFFVFSMPRIFIDLSLFGFYIKLLLLLLFTMDNFDSIFGHFNAVAIVEFRQRPMDYVYWIGVGFISVVSVFRRKIKLNEKNVDESLEFVVRSLGNAFGDRLKSEIRMSFQRELNWQKACLYLPK